MFTPQEQEIIKYGLQNGKSQQEVTQAIANFRSGVKPNPQKNVAPQQNQNGNVNVGNTSPLYLTGEKPLPVPFESNAGDSTVKSVGKQIANAPTDVLNFLNLFNPIKNLKTAGKNISDIITETAQYASDNNENPLTVIGKSLVSGADKPGQMPDIYKNTLKALFPKFIQDVMKGDFESAKKSIIEHPVQEIAPLVLLALGIAKEAGLTNEFNNAMGETGNENAPLGEIKMAPEQWKNTWSNEPVQNETPQTEIPPVVEEVKPTEIPQDNAFKKAGRYLSGIFVRPTEKMAKMVQDYEAGVSNINPVTEADTAARLGIDGTDKQMGVKAAAKAKDIWKNTIEPAVDGIKSELTADELLKRLQKKITDEPDLSRKADLRKALNDLKDEYKFSKKTKFAQWQAVKSSIDENTPKKVLEGDRAKSAYVDMRNELADEIRRATYNELADQNIKQDYLDWGNLQKMQKEGIEARKMNIANRPSFTNIKSLVIDHTFQPIVTKLGSYIYNMGDYNIISKTKLPLDTKTAGDVIKTQYKGLTLDDLLNQGIIYPIYPQSTKNENEQ